MAQENEVPVVGANIQVELQPDGVVMLHVLADDAGYPDSHMCFSPKLAFEVGNALVKAAHRSTQLHDRNTN